MRLDVKQHKYYIVYKITNLLNNMEYIGYHSTDDLDDGYMGSGLLIRRAVKKHGVKNFKKEILHIFDNSKDAEALERKLVNQEYIDRKDTYNIVLGGNITQVKGSKIELSKENRENIDRQIAILTNRVLANHTTDNSSITTELLTISNKTYSCIFDAMIDLGIKHEIEVKELLIEDGNGYLNPYKQLQFEKEYLNELILKKEKIDLHLDAVRRTTQDPKRNSKISKALKGRKCPWLVEFNKNPEKIAKTAAKHRGMKRSKLTCENISIAKKAYFEDNDVYNKDMIFIHNLLTNERTYINEGDPIPDGWELGLGPTKARGKKWYMNPNDLTLSKNFGPDELIPEGWVPGNGGLRLAREQKRKLKQQQKELANGSIDI